MRKFLLPIVVLVAGCAAPPQVPPSAVPPATPVAAAAPFEAWEVVTSRIEVRIYRDGPMQKLGHNHLITSNALAGVIELREPRTASGFTLQLPLDSLVVDDSAARALAGPDFANPVPENDRNATRRNMLGEAVLDAARQALLRLTVDSLTGGPVNFEARVRVGLRGEERLITLPLTVNFDGDRMQVQANVHLRHADLGLAPFTAALGALRVRDDFEVECRLEARRST